MQNYYFRPRFDNNKNKNMLSVNEYFEGKVKSIGFNNAEGKVTAGVMEIGEYEFGTATVEYMTVTSGKLIVLLPGETEWKTFGRHETFIVDKDQSFKVKVEEETSYICVYK